MLTPFLAWRAWVGDCINYLALYACFVINSLLKWWGELSCYLYTKVLKYFGNLKLDLRLKKLFPCIEG